MNESNPVSFDIGSVTGLEKNNKDLQINCHWILTLKNQSHSVYKGFLFPPHINKKEKKNQAIKWAFSRLFNLLKITIKFLNSHLTTLLNQVRVPPNLKKVMSGNLLGPNLMDNGQQSVNQQTGKYIHRHMFTCVKLFYFENNDFKNIVKKLGWIFLYF